MSPKSLNQLIGIAAKYIISKMTIFADEVSSVYMYIYMYNYVYVYILLHTIHIHIYIYIYIIAVLILCNYTRVLNGWSSLIIIIDLR